MEHKDNKRAINNVIQWIHLIDESVHSSDDQDIGDIDAVNRNFVVVKRGFINVHYYYIPMSKVEGWDGHILWLTITEEEVKQKFERNILPDPASYYVKNYPGYTSAYYPPIILGPVKKLVRPVQNRIGKYASYEPSVYRCDLCDTTFQTADDLSKHVQTSH